MINDQIARIEKVNYELGRLEKEIRDCDELRQHHFFRNYVEQKLCLMQERLSHVSIDLDLFEYLRGGENE